MPRPLSLAEHTLLAELIERSLDEMFDEQFAENGSFIERAAPRRNGTTRNYLYYQGYQPGNGARGAKTRYAKYVGPADDPKLVERVRRFQEIKTRRRENARLVDALVGAGLPRPPVVMGRIVEALAKAGVFRLRAALVGTAAYQVYPAVLGMRLDETAATTGDVDIAQFRSISLGVEDSTPPLLEVLTGVDPTFRAVPARDPRNAPTAFINASGFRVDVLTPHRGGDDEMRAPLKLDSLGGVSGQPLRFLDFLIRQTVRSVVLHGPGVSVNAPAPERFAVHKLIVATRRDNDAVGLAKARKDVLQAAEVILALDQSSRGEALGAAWREAWGRGPSWRDAMQKGAALLAPQARSIIDALGSRSS